MKDITIIAGIIVFIGIVIGLVFISNHFTYLQCKNNVEEMNREFRYDMVNGCRIGLEDGTFIYWKMYREINN